MLGRAALAHRAVPVGQARDPDARDAPRAGRRVDQGARRARAQPAATSTSTFPLGVLRRGHRRERRGQEHARERHPPPGADAEALPVDATCRGRTSRSRASSTIDKVIDIDQSPIGRTPRSNPATYTGVFDKIRDAVRRHPGGEGARLPARAVLVQREGRPLRGVRGRRHDQDRDALPPRRVRAVRGVQGRALQPRHARHHVQGQEHRRGARPVDRGGARVLRQPADDRAVTCRRWSTSGSATCGSASRRRRCRAARRSG